MSEQVPSSAEGDDAIRFKKQADFYESECRKLEERNTNQKLEYEGRIKKLEEEKDGLKGELEQAKMQIEGLEKAQKPSEDQPATEQEQNKEEGVSPNEAELKELLESKSQQITDLNLMNEKLKEDIMRLASSESDLKAKLEEAEQNLKNAQEQQKEAQEKPPAEQTLISKEDIDQLSQLAESLNDVVHSLSQGTPITDQILEKFTPMKDSEAKGVDGLMIQITEFKEDQADAVKAILEKHMIQVPAAFPKIELPYNFKLMQSEEVKSLTEAKASEICEELKFLASTMATTFNPFSTIKSDGNLVLLEILSQQIYLQTTWLQKLDQSVSYKVKSRAQLALQVVQQRLANLLVTEITAPQKQSDQDDATVLQAKFDETLQQIKSELESQLQEKDDLLLDQEEKLLQLTEKIKDLQHQLEILEKAEAEAREIAEKLQSEADSVKEGYESQITAISDKLSEKEELLNSTMSELNEQTSRLNEIKEDIEQAEEAIRVYRDRITQLEEENDAFAQRYDQQEALTSDLKQDMQQLLKYKDDLEGVLEEQTAMLETKNKRVHLVDEQIRNKENQIEQSESACKRLQGMNDEARKKVMSLEVKIKQLTAVTVKDLKQQLKERQAEVEVLKEMVKSSNTQIKAKDIDIQRLQKKIQTLQQGNRGMSAQRDGSGSRGSRMSGRNSPKPASYQGAGGVQAIQEADPIFEQTGGDPYQQPAKFQSRTRQQEWEEAVELDRLLEAERREQSMKQLNQKADNQYNDYMSNLRSGKNRQTGGGLGAVLGGGSGSTNVGPQGGAGGYNVGSLPDLFSSKNRDNFDLEFSDAKPAQQMTPGYKARGGRRY